MARLTRRELDVIQRERAGCRRLAYARSTGSLTSIYDAESQGLDPDGDPWVAVCEDHGAVVCAPTLKLAQWSATAPEEFCEDCQDMALRAP